MNTPFTDHLVSGATWLLLVGGVWSALLVGAAAVERLSLGRVPALAAVGCPATWRPVLLWALGAALAVGAAGPANARAPQPLAPSDLPVPARPVDSRPVDGRPVDSGPVLVEVAPGDSLWALAEAWAPGAGPAEVQRLVGRTHRLNRAAIGADPDLLHPGLRLRVPPPPS